MVDRLLKFVVIGTFVVTASLVSYGQDSSCGRPDGCGKPGGKPTGGDPGGSGPKPGTGRSNTGGGGGGNTPTPQPPKSPQKQCDGGAVEVVCGFEDCEVSVGGRFEAKTDLNGKVLIQLGKGTSSLTISKAGYNPQTKNVRIDCDETEAWKVALVPKPYPVSIATDPGTEVVVNEGAVKRGIVGPSGKMDFTSPGGTTLVRLARPGYISESIELTPAKASGTVEVRLQPAPVLVNLDTGDVRATAYVDGSEEGKDTSETLYLQPGLRRIVVSSLGYRSQGISLDVKVGQSVRQRITLERLPASELVAESQKLLRGGAYANARQLANAALKSEPSNGAAKAVVGMSFVSQNNFTEAVPHLLGAIANGGTFTIAVRRHLDNRFELSSGHGSACLSKLTFSRSGVVFNGGSSNMEDFNVPFGQIQLMGQSLKKNLALNLKVKVTDARGKKKDYEFFSAESEMSSSGRPFLLMLENLLRGPGGL